LNKKDNHDSEQHKHRSIKDTKNMTLLTQIPTSTRRNGAARNVNATDGIVGTADAGCVARIAGTPYTPYCRRQTLSSCCRDVVWMAANKRHVSSFRRRSIGGDYSHRSALFLSTLCPKKTSPFYFSNNSCQKL